MSVPHMYIEESASRQLTPQNVIDLIVENGRVIIIAPIFFGFFAGAASFAVPKQYAAEATFIAPQSQTAIAASMLESIGQMSGLAGSVADVKNPSDQFVSLLKSRTIADALVNKFDLKSRYEVSLGDDARNELSKRTSVSFGKDAIIRVSLTQLLS